MIFVVWWALNRFGLFKQRTVPAELIGVWTTTAPGYEGRALEFTEHSVLLHRDGYHFSVYQIRWITRGRHDLFSTYRIEYQETDGVTPLVFRFIPSPRPLIRLEHPFSVWRRMTPR